jgi:hypothetical protein
MNLYQRTVMFLALRAAREKSQICCTAYKKLQVPPSYS